MNTERINILLNKYWDCETSVSEEKELQDFFAFGNVPAEFQDFVPLFSYKNASQNETLGVDFDSRLENALSQKSKEKKYVTIKIFEPFLRIAASIIIIAGIGIALFGIAKQKNQIFAETYNDPNMALEKATFALEKLSSALQLSEEASIESLKQLQDFDLNWAILDSLSSEIPFHEVEKNDVENGNL